MTDERASTLTALIEAVEAWSRAGSHRDNTIEEDRIIDALIAIRRSGADITLLMPMDERR
jgi:hypothetical protein